MVTVCENECSGHGECVSHTHCVCSFGYYGASCQTCVTQIYPVEWNTINIICSTIFGGITVLTFLQLLVLLFVHKRPGVLRKVLMASTMLAALTRFIWLVVDPFGFEGILPPIAESLLYQMVLGFICTAFSCVIAFWVKLMRVLVPNTFVQCCTIRTEVIFVVLNVVVWTVLLPAAILFKVLPYSIAPIVLDVYSIYVGAYLTCMAIGFLTFGLRIYIGYTRRMGIPAVDNTSLIQKTTILAVTTSIVLITSIVSVLLGATYLLNYPSTPVKYITFQTIYRGLEVAFCTLVLVLTGNWEVREWDAFKLHVLTLSGRSTNVDDDFERHSINEDAQERRAILIT